MKPVYIMRTELLPRGGGELLLISPAVRPKDDTGHSGHLHSYLFQYVLPIQSVSPYFVKHLNPHTPRAILVSKGNCWREQLSGENQINRRMPRHYPLERVIRGEGKFN